jgi:NADPH2:quinone reductase
MKAAVIHNFGEIPKCEEFPDPVGGVGDLRIRVLAAVLENFDKMVASGSHYSSRQLFPGFPAIVGHSGVGKLPDGTTVAFGGVKPPYGTMAEIAILPEQFKPYLSVVPEGVSASVAAALPSCVLTSLLPLKYGVKLQPGETVLINGATGVSGKIAVQIAKILGAGRIVGSGRGREGLDSLRSLGADAAIDLKQPDDQVQRAYAIEAGKGFDVVLDFIWGHPTELLFKTLIPKEAGFPRHRTRYVQVGEAAGSTISVSADMLRTSGLEIGSHIPRESIPEAVNQTWAWIQEERLQIEIEVVPLSNITEAWQRETRGTRIVIVPGR